MYSDASLSGWSAARGSISSGGRWSLNEALYHTTILELVRAYVTFKSVRLELADKNVQLMLGNTITILVVNHMSTNYTHLWNTMAVKIWSLCQDNRIWITACHSPGEENSIAEKESC